MRQWLLTQAMVYFPSLIFCALAAVAFYLSPDEDLLPPPLLETQAINANLSRISAAGDRLFLRAARLTQRADGVVDLERLRTRTLHGNGEVVLNGSSGFLNAAGERLIIESASGEIKGERVLATLSLQTAAYDLRANALSGEMLRWRQQGGVFSGDSFVLDGDGRVVLTGRVRAVFGD